MRPLRVELQGFGSFRDATEVDLADVDLFVLAGPTGAGKSTVLDAIIFALYGCVPRYDDRRLVAPAINQGRNEARVRLTFALDGRTYTATRVVRRTKVGATTKEARLEDVTGGGQQVLAGTADELTERVTALVGLSFEQFSRSVVLPQGAFDRFLFARPADRADLLVQLLDLGVYEEIGKRARAEGTRAQARAGEIQRRLDGELATATPKARDQAAARVEALTALLGEVEAAEADLDAIIEDGHRARQQAEAARATRDALAGLRRPEALDDLSARLAASAEAVDLAQEALTAAVAAREATEDQLATLPDAAVLDRLTDLRRRLERHAEERRAAEQDLAAASAQADRTAREQLQAEARLADARARLEDARRHEAAQALARGLSAGDPCPVCARPLDRAPAHDTAAIAAVEAALATAESRLAAARQAHQDATSVLAGARQAVQSALGQAEHDADEHARLLAAHELPGDAGEQEALAARVRRLGGEAERHRRAEREARATLERAQQEAARHRDAQRRALADFDAARDRVAGLGPPPADRDSVARCWDELLAWAAQRLPDAQQEAADAEAAVEAVSRRWRETDDQLRAQARLAGVEVDARARVSVAVGQSLAAAQHRLTSLTEALEAAAALRQDLAAVRERHQVAEALGDHLRANRFERWLLNRALRVLVEGASRILRELSSGAYSLALDERNEFLVTDHRNADEPRTARSLSGGERFLASLALALALADHVAELAAEGAPRLESLFLDEGFGTLDADTLDVVAAAIEELGARGRMVGVITHVRDLAERIPVRFEVRRGPAGSLIERRDPDAAAQGDAA